MTTRDISNYKPGNYQKEKMSSQHNVYQAIRELQKETASNRKAILEHDKRFEEIERMLKKK